MAGRTGFQKITSFFSSGISGKRPRRSETDNDSTSSETDSRDSLSSSDSPRDETSATVCESTVYDIWDFVHRDCLESNPLHKALIKKQSATAQPTVAVQAVQGREEEVWRLPKHFALLLP